MQKFLKIVLSDAPTLIPIDKILGVEVGANTHIKVLTGIVGHTATGASQVLGYQITATTASDAPKTKEQLTAFVAEMSKALQTDWKKPVYDITEKLPYAVTAISQIEEEWSA